MSSKFRVLINFSTLKTGGGQNVALNFLMASKEIELPGVEFFFLVAKGSRVHDFLEDCGHDNFFAVSSNPVVRMIGELTWIRSVIDRFSPHIIYSYFGYGLFGGKYKQVSGSADSNLYFPEVDFWKDEPPLTKLRRWLVDKYRTYGITRSTAVVYENRLMEERGRSIYGIENTTFIGPSIIDIGKASDFHPPVGADFERTKLLFLCGWQRNKNIMLIPEIARIARDAGHPFTIYLTAVPDQSAIHRQFDQLIDEFDVRDSVHVIGQIDKSKLASLFSNIDYVMLLSQLESFSNNIIESWSFERNLVVADQGWARSICEDSAIYVQRDSARDIVDKILGVELDSEYKARLIKNGTAMLESYPTIEERIVQEISFLRSVYETT